MRWRSIRELYDESEKVDTVWDELVRGYYVPVAYANTEMYGKCNIAIRLSSGHIVVDDCSESRLNGRTFRSEDEWRRMVGLEEDMEMIEDLFGGR